MSTIKLTKEEESFIQNWTVIHHEKGEFYYIPYYFKKNKPSDPRNKEETVWKIVSFDHLPDEIREMIRKSRIMIKL